LVISKILNHVERGVTAVCDRHSYDNEKKIALDAWARTLTAIIEQKSADVLTFAGGHHDGQTVGIHRRDHRHRVAETAITLRHDRGKAYLDAPGPTSRRRSMPLPWGADLRTCHQWGGGVAAPRSRRFSATHGSRRMVSEKIVREIAAVRQMWPRKTNRHRISKSGSCGR
jgi:hypothetical protein